MCLLCQDETGNMVWICPSCKREDDGLDPMIGCDICDEWFHW
jgi:transcription initiation factor TFIID subunit 3